VLGNTGLLSRSPNFFISLIGALLSNDMQGAGWIDVLGQFINALSLCFGFGMWAPQLWACSPCHY